MGIKAFHFVFVAVSILLCVFLAVWGLSSWRSTGQAGHLVLGCGAILTGMVLLVYGRYVLRKLKGMSYL
jgi:hypothetical protein